METANYLENNSNNTFYQKPKDAVKAIFNNKMNNSEVFI